MREVFPPRLVRVQLQSQPRENLSDALLGLLARRFRGTHHHEIVRGAHQDATSNFTSSISSFGRPGHMLGNFTHGHAVAVDSKVNLYIAGRITSPRPAQPC
jgi:hypothetical protein